MSSGAPSDRPASRSAETRGAGTSPGRASHGASPVGSSADRLADRAVVGAVRGHFEPTDAELRRRAAIQPGSAMPALLLEHAAWEFIEYFDLPAPVAFVHGTRCSGECLFECNGMFVCLPADHVRRTE